MVASATLMHSIKVPPPFYPILLYVETIFSAFQHSVKTVVIMKKSLLSTIAFCASLSSFSSQAADQLDPRIVGNWYGMRDPGGMCEFLAWKSKFSADGRFEITFFSDKERTEKIQTEKGTWKTGNGKNELKTDGVPTAEVYVYTVIDDDTIKYVNTMKDPSADCQADYEFTERRIKN